MSRASAGGSNVTAAAIDSRLANVYKASPAIVVKYDADTKTCTVQPVTRAALEDEDGQLVLNDRQQIQNVPVAFFGSAALSLVCELVPGDAVMLVFQDQSFAGWRRTGKVSDPGDTRTHGPSYPIAYPWYRPSGGPGASGEGDASIGHPGGLRVYFESSHARVGSSETDTQQFVALKPAVDALQTHADTHIHGTPWGPTTPAVSPVGPQTSSTKLKA